MATEYVQNGRIELKLNEDRTQALMSIFPSSGGGEPVTIAEVRDRLKVMGVTYGVRDMAIRDAIRYAEDTGKVANGVVAAQGTLPQDGKDAKIQYILPCELLSKPLPKRNDGLPCPDWFALDTAKMVRSGQELASIIPPQPGVPGKTLTWPIQPIQPKHGKTATLSAGLNVQTIEGTKLCATSDGYVCLHGEVLTVHAIRIVEEDLRGEQHFSVGAVINANAIQSRIRSESFVAIQGATVNCQLRAETDIIIRYAENCEIASAGNIYVVETLKNCQVTARKRVMTARGGRILGGSICAAEGVYADEIGQEGHPRTEIHTGFDRFADFRNQEIQEELAVCEANIKRIGQALQPFTIQSRHTQLSDEKRALLLKLQSQKRTQDAKISSLHTERRTLTLARKERLNGPVIVNGKIWPGSCIEICDAAMMVETPMFNVRFKFVENSKAVEVESLIEAAA